MSTLPMFLDQRIEDFRKSIAFDLFSPKDFIEWRAIEQQVNKLNYLIAEIQELVDKNELNFSSIVKLGTEQPEVYEVFKLLCAVSGTVGFEDGREFPARPPRDEMNWRMLSSLLLDIGIQQILPSKTSVENLVRLAIIAVDAEKRRFRVRNKLDQLTTQIILRAIEESSILLGEKLSLLPSNRFPSVARNKVEHIVTRDTVPVIAIATVFQTQSGGRQQRDLELTYPSLQQRLDEVPLSLILIADGRGVGEASDRVLQLLFENVASVMTISQAEHKLSGEIVKFVQSYGDRTQYQAPLSRIIESLLNNNFQVTIKQLPVGEERAKLALAQYATEQQQYGLILSHGGGSLQWKRPTIVINAQRLNREYSAANAISILCELLEVESSSLKSSEDLVPVLWTTLNLTGETIIPSTLFVAAIDQNVDFDTLNWVAKKATSEFIESRVALLLTPSLSSSGEIRASSGMQAVLSSSVVVIDAQDLLIMARSSINPRDFLINLILEQSDLTKVSPFVVSSVTPRKMFFGREEEAASLVSTLPTNSVALLGSRKIGKTSLMKYVHARLDDEGFSPLFGDCQTVRTWSDFGRLVIRRQWNMDISDDFQPYQLFDIVSNLENKGRKNIVFLLDEIDQLLDWDSRDTGDDVPEAFFRACRTISQQGIAQFVFSGERTITRKLSDSQSSHWNFCRDLKLQQLKSDAGERLLITTLERMGIRISERDIFWAEAWERTTGHPQLLQSLGDKLVRLLNTRPSNLRSELNLQDLLSVSDNYDYAEQFLETYWGQARKIERLISLLVASGFTTIYALEEKLRGEHVSLTTDEISDALRILDLYGMLVKGIDGYSVKLPWFSNALTHFGGLPQATIRLLREVRQ